MKIGLIKKKKERCVAQQRVNLTKKEGIFEVFCQTNWYFRTQLSNQCTEWCAELLVPIKNFKEWMLTVLYGYSNSFFTSKKTHKIYIIYYSL